MSRDLALERELLNGVVRRAKRLGLDARAGRGFARRVANRLDAGDRIHGDSFLERDCLAEAVEEAEDLVAWSLLAADSAEATGRLGHSLRIDLEKAAVLAALADFHLRRARSTREQGARG